MKTSLATRLPLAFLVALLPVVAHAESNVSTGTGTLTATGRVNFSITIPRVLFLQVGTGTLLASNGTIDTIAFTPSAGVVGSGAAVAATAGSGDLGNGQVTVRVIGNVGSVALTATGPATLTNGTGGTIAWTQIVTAVSGGTTHPIINGAGVSYPASGNVVNLTGGWTYTYANSVTPAAGTYTGTVTYTATTP